MSGKLKVGDKVECVDASGLSGLAADYLERGAEYIVEISEHDNLRVEGVCFGFDPRRFKLVGEPVTSYELATMPMLTMQLGTGLGFTIDPNIPLSRKFAEAFLDAVYGAKND